MSEYVPLMSAPPADYDNEGFESPKTQLQFQQRSDNFSANNCTTLAWFTILAVIMAISAAAVFRICISSATSELELIRSPSDITKTLRMVQPSPNLEKGRQNIGKLVKTSAL